MLIIRKKVRDKVRKTKGNQIDIPFLPHIERENWAPALFHSVLNLAKALDEMFTKLNNLADYILASNEIETPEIANELKQYQLMRANYISNPRSQQGYNRLLCARKELLERPGYYQTLFSQVEKIGGIVRSNAE